MQHGPKFPDGALLTYAYRQSQPILFNLRMLGLGAYRKQKMKKEIHLNDGRTFMTTM